MTEIGATCKAKELGYTGRAIYVWYPCPNCRTPRWMLLSSKGTRCRSCVAQERARTKSPVSYHGVGEPRVGDTALASLLGYSGRGVYIFEACPDCGRTRWVRHSYSGVVCNHCIPKVSGSRHHRWCDNRTTKRGYVTVRIGKDDPFYCMSRDGWVLEHRLIIARLIGRPLKPNEIVHHINGIKADNRPSNLRLLTESRHSSHMVITELRDRIRELEQRVIELEANIVLLRSDRGDTSERDQNLQCHNTPSNDFDGVVEGIVQAFSNEGDNNIESV